MLCLCEGVMEIKTGDVLDFQNMLIVIWSKLKLEVNKWGNASRPVVDLEGVPWVPWNPTFEGLPLKILCVNVLHTLRPHWSHAEAACFTIAYTCVFKFYNFLYQEFDSRALCIRARIYSRRMCQPFNEQKKNLTVHNNIF